jgi:carbon storage regulator CsrA
MKTFQLEREESVIMDGDIKITVIEIDGDEVTLAIDAPEWMAVEDGELLNNMQLVC